MIAFEETISSELIYKGKIIEVRVEQAKLFDREVTRELVLHNGGVCVAAFTDDDEIILVKQFRYPFKEGLIELPAGKLEKNEDHYSAGLRELAEEVGATPDIYEYLGVLYPSVAYLYEKIHIYYAKSLHFGETHFDDDEYIEVLKVPFEEAVEMVLNNEIKDAKTAAGILMIAAKRNKK
ncbi:MAG: NUDIX hydrolase [Ruminococcus sp.]|jgi:ADP-ribose pyrophosphatase|nr:NUDIX hydrolase [Ruminococcus sp.]